MAYTETFEGTPGADLPVHNTVWQTSTGGTTAEISSDGHSFQATSGAGNPDANYYNNTFADKHYSKGTLVASPTGAAGVTIRHQTGTNAFYYAIWDQGTTNVFVGEYSAGTPTDWVGGANLTGFVGGDVIELAVDPTTSTTILLKRNGTTHTTFTSKSALSLGKAGVCAFLGSSATLADWEGGDVTGVPAVPSPYLLLFGVG